MLGLAVTLARFCFEGEDLESTRTALEKAASHVDHLRTSSEHGHVGDGHTNSAVKLEVDYLTIRIALVSCFAAKKK